MLLEVKDINTYYGLSHILHGVNISVGEGEIVCLLGRNGMGKSTTLKSIMGLAKIGAGSIIFNGKDIAGKPSYRVAKAGVGYVPEERRIFSNLTVKDNLEMGIKYGKTAPIVGDPWDLDRVYKHFPRLKERQNNKGANLSGGEQQLLSMARSLMGNPSLLLVDEPCEGLAPLIVQEVRDVLRLINQAGVSILLVEHNLPVAMSLAHRIYLVGKGEIGFEGTVEDLEANPEIKSQYLEV